MSLINSWIHQDDSYHSYSKYRFDMVTTGSLADLGYSKIPFLETSYNLQKTSDDGNCVIYSLNNIEAIINMLQNEETAANLLELAKDESKEAFQIAFAEGIKHYLPQYFDCNVQSCLPHTPMELASYHAQKSWDMGSKFIEQYVCAEIVEENATLQTFDIYKEEL